MKLRIKKAQRGMIKSSVMPLERPKDVKSIFLECDTIRSLTNIYQDIYMQKEEKEELEEDSCQVNNKQKTSLFNYFKRERTRTTKEQRRSGARRYWSR